MELFMEDYDQISLVNTVSHEETKVSSAQISWLADEKAQPIDFAEFPSAVLFGDEGMLFSEDIYDVEVRGWDLDRDPVIYFNPRIKDWLMNKIS